MFEVLVAERQRPVLRTVLKHRLVVLVRQRHTQVPVSGGSSCPGRTSQMNASCGWTNLIMGWSLDAATLTLAQRCWTDLFKRFFRETAWECHCAARHVRNKLLPEASLVP